MAITRKSPKQASKAIVEALRRLSEASIMDTWAESAAAEIQKPAEHFDPEFMQKLVGLMKKFASYFDAEVRGIDRLPDRNVMLVGNHSGGAITPDTSALYVAWYERRGFKDPLVCLAMDAGFAVPRFRNLIRKMGQMPASSKNAQLALDAGKSVLVYPGGTHEVFRTWKQRNRIMFNDRKGFIRVALRTGVPVVPVVGHGGHETTIVLSRGKRLVKLFGVDKIRMDAVPVMLQLPWGLSTPGFPSIPLPAKITVQVCEPLDWSRYGPEDADNPEVLQRCYVEITEGMQGTLDGLARENPRPIMTRFRSLLSR